MAGLSRLLAGRRAVLWLALALALTLMLWSRPGVARQAASEGQVKAAYLFKFAGFVEWPEGSFARPDSSLQIGVAGSDALAEQLELMVAGRSIGGHAISVRKIRRGEPVAGIHILFVGAAERAAMAELLAAARGQPVLTVSDADDAVALGCMIAFVIADQRLRFDVGMAHVAAARLRISARMLAAANRILGVT